jgi:hypothetical protein
MKTTRPVMFTACALMACVLSHVRTEGQSPARVPAVALAEAGETLSESYRGSQRDNVDYPIQMIAARVRATA